MQYGQQSRMREGMALLNAVPPTACSFCYPEHWADAAHRIPAFRKKPFEKGKMLNESVVQHCMDAITEACEEKVIE